MNKWTIQLRRDTTLNWHKVNPILKDGEMAIDTNEIRIKIGDGVTKWEELPFWNPNGITPSTNFTVYYGFYKQNTIDSTNVKTLKSKSIANVLTEYTDTQQDNNTPQYFYIIVPKNKASEIDFVTQEPSSLGTIWNDRQDISIDGIDYTTIRSPHTMYDLTVIFETSN